MSGLKIVVPPTEQEQKRADALARGKYLVTERLCRTPEGKLAPEDKCTDGGTLLYTAGTEIPLEEARACGLVGPEKKDDAKPEATKPEATKSELENSAKPEQESAAKSDPEPDAPKPQEPEPEKKDDAKPEKSGKGK